MKKRIMVLGAARGQLELIKSIKDNGHTAIVASVKGNYPGIDIADEFCEVDITDVEAVAEASRKYRVDAITTCCSDTAIASLGYACDKNGLIGLSSRAAKISNDKFLMKTAFIENGVNTAKYMKVSSKDEIISAIKDLSFPMIVKAVDLQGSKGIYIAENEDELYDSFNKTMNYTKKDFCIIEEFIVGEDFGVQAFIIDGEVLYILPTGNITHLCGTNVPVGHYVPLKVSNELNAKIIEQVQLAIKAIGLNNCAVNVDLLKKDDEIYVIELTGRIGANCIPELSSIYYGYDVYKMIYLVALGENAVEFFNSTKSDDVTPCYAKMLISDKTGTVKRIVNKNDMNDSRINQIKFFIKEGEIIRKFENSSDCYGQVIVNGDSVELCEEFINEVISNITVEFDEN